jgi:hypothetical protein
MAKIVRDDKEIDNEKRKASIELKKQGFKFLHMEKDLSNGSMIIFEMCYPPDPEVVNPDRALHYARLYGYLNVEMRGNLPNPDTIPDLFTRKLIAIAKMAKVQISA